MVVTGLMCGAILLDAPGWIPARWALYGGLLAVLRLGILSYWMNTFFAGSVAALGGALVLGAWPRIRRRASLRDAVLMALGLGISGHSRPYEGFIFSLPLRFVLIFLVILREQNFKLGENGYTLHSHCGALLFGVCVRDGLLQLAGDGQPGAAWGIRSIARPMLWHLFPYATTEACFPAYHHAVMQRFYQEARDEGLSRGADCFWICTPFAAQG